MTTREPAEPTANALMLSSDELRLLWNLLTHPVCLLWNLLTHPVCELSPEMDRVQLAIVEELRLRGERIA